MGVKLLGLQPFLESVGNAMRPRMNMSIYDGTFECACGSSHWYGPHITLLCEGRMRVVMVCPDDPAYLTNVAIKTFMLVKFKGFASIAGFHASTPRDETLVSSVFSALT